MIKKIGLYLFWGGVALLILAMLGVIACAATVSQADSNSTDQRAMAWMTIGLAMLVLLIVLGLTLWIISRLLNWLFFSNSSVFGANASARILALAIVTVCGSATVTALIKAPFEFVLSLADSLVASLRTIASFSDILAKGSRGLGVLPSQQLADSVLNTAASGLTRAMRELLGRFEIAKLVRVLAGWALIGQLISPFVTGGDGQGASSPAWIKKLTDRLSKVKKEGWQNVTLIALLTIGLYLGISALVLVPWLREGASVDPRDGDKLAETLQQTASLEDYPEKRQDVLTPFDNLEALLLALQHSAKIPLRPTTKPALSSTQPTSLPAAIAQATEAHLPELERISPQRKEELASRLERSLHRARSLRESAFDMWKRGQQSALDKRKEFLANAREGYARSLTSPMTKIERGSYFQDVVEWYRVNMENVGFRLRNIRGYVDRYEDDLRYWAEKLDRDYRVTIQLLADESPEEQRNIADYLSWSNEPYLDEAYSWNSSQGSKFPQLPKAGLSLGIFGLIAGWLLKTQSLAMGLITGMIGFGILGSAISTFVRERTERTQNDSLIVQNVGGVAIRGVSAAIVVYLAVIGGLSVFAAEVEKPNPYSLFLTCLVGAVFSERIWEWAQRYLGERLGDRIGRAGAKPAGGAFTKGDRVRLREDIAPGRAGEIGVVTLVTADKVTVKLDEGDRTVGPAEASKFEPMA